MHIMILCNQTTTLISNTGVVEEDAAADAYSAALAWMPEVAQYGHGPSSTCLFTW